jgi:hypothetical protein
LSVTALLLQLDGPTVPWGNPGFPLTRSRIGKMKRSFEEVGWSRVKGHKEVV